MKTHDVNSIHFDCVHIGTERYVSFQPPALIDLHGSVRGESSFTTTTMEAKPDTNVIAGEHEFSIIDSLRKNPIPKKTAFVVSSNRERAIWGASSRFQGRHGNFCYHLI